jgi:hypothetical protein
MPQPMSRKLPLLRSMDGEQGLQRHEEVPRKIECRRLAWLDLRVGAEP